MARTAIALHAISTLPIEGNPILPIASTEVNADSNAILNTAVQLNVDNILSTSASGTFANYSEIIEASIFQLGIASAPISTLVIDETVIIVDEVQPPTAHPLNPEQTQAASESVSELDTSIQIQADTTTQTDQTAELDTAISVSSDAVAESKTSAELSSSGNNNAVTNLESEATNQTDSSVALDTMITLTSAAAAESDAQSGLDTSISLSGEVDNQTANDAELSTDISLQASPAAATQNTAQLKSTQVEYLSSIASAPISTYTGHQHQVDLSIALDPEVNQIVDTPIYNPDYEVAALDKHFINTRQNLKIWPPKSPFEAIWISFNFEQDLQGEERITGANVTIDLRMGDDPNPTAMKASKEHIMDEGKNRVMIKLQGGEHMAQYLCKCFASLSSGRVLMLAAALPVRTLN